MFQIKICGITTSEDAQMCADAGADAIGLNFYEKSPRSVCIEKAAEISNSVISNSVTGQLQQVGVFVNLPANQVNQIAAAAKLDWVQLHGDEPPELLADIATDVQVLRVYRFQAGDEQRVETDLEKCKLAGRLPDGVLLDAAIAGHYGGSGESIPWASLAGERPWLLGLPFVLAGGLNPENVLEAVKAVRPSAVDVASGVESAPGRKDREKVARFVEKARSGSLG